MVSPSPFDRSLLGVSSVGRLVAFNDIPGRQGAMLFRYSVPDTTREYKKAIYKYLQPVTKGLTTLTYETV
jgi:hypothetical protein